jgi:hypothetical protein
MRSHACATLVVWAALGSACGRFGFDEERAAAVDAADAVAPDAPSWPSIALAVDTGSAPDLVAIASAHASDGAAGFAAFGPEVAGVLGPIVAADAVLWSKRLDQVFTGTPWDTQPSDVDVVFAIDGSGIFAAMAIPLGAPEHALAVLTTAGLTTESVASWGTTAGAVVHPYVVLDRRSNVLATFLLSLYVQEVNGGRIAGGLPVACSSYGCGWGQVVPGFEQLRFRLYNGFTEPVAVFLSVLFALQPQTQWGCGCPFDGVAFSASPWAAMYGALNQRWNPKSDPQVDGPVTRSFAIQPATSRGTFLTAFASGDNQNSGSIALDGTTASQFVNSMPGGYQYHRAAGPIPATVNMQLTNNWSTSKAEIRIAVIGTWLAFDLIAETPTAPTGDNNPSPLSLSLPPGWTE